MKADRISRICRIVLALAVAVGVVTAPRLQAQTFSVVHDFTGSSDGGSALAGLAIDSKGIIYGTASAGGSSGAGVVFKMNRQGNLTVLHNFAGGSDGSTPESRVIIDAKGDLYGTTFAGGAADTGTVYRVTKAGKESVLYSFAGGTDGANPIAGLAMDAAGDVYGTTTAGGAYGYGTVFKVTRPTKQGQPWTESILYSFNDTDGQVPVAGVTLGKRGNLYGTASVGGAYGYGTVFELQHSESGWTEKIIYTFQMQNDGGTPYGGLTMDASGNLYGTATNGGDGSSGGGTVFELTPSKGNWTFNVLYGLAGWGISGTFRDLLLDGSGKIYATTHCDGNNDAGTVYELTLSGGVWTYTSLYVFTGGTDGLYSFSNLVLDKQGNLYGTTNMGGTNGYGVIFKVAP
jgi:uncharacterized repeat protein (TIGR03803 family)